MNTPIQPLTPAEKRTMLRLFDNCNAKQAADRDSVSFDTVQNHCKSIRKKCGNVTMVTAAYRCLAQNIFAPGELPSY